MHYHVWIRIDLDTMDRDTWRYRTRSAAYKYISRHLGGKEAMVLQCEMELGLSPHQRELVWQKALRVAEEVAFRGLRHAAQSVLETAASRLTELVVTDVADEEIGGGDVAAIFEENSAKIERLLFGYIERPWSTRPGGNDPKPRGDRR